jgi:hypothetical protein
LTAIRGSRDKRQILGLTHALLAFLCIEVYCAYFGDDLKERHTFEKGHMHWHIESILEALFLIAGRRKNSAKIIR